MQISFTHGAPEGVRLPRYRLLVLGPFDPGHPGAAPQPLAPADQSAVLSTLAPRLTLGVPNLLSDAGATWWVQLQVRELADFTPAGLLRGIPELAWISGLRAGIEAVATGQAPLADLAARLGDYAGVSGLAPVLDHCRRVIANPPGTEAATPSSAPAPAPAATPAATAGSDAVDRIFDLVDAPAGTAPPPPSAGRTAIASTIAAVARTARPRPVAALQGALTAIDDLLGRQLSHLLNDPQWQALEGAWRSLRELLAAVDRSGRVEVLLCPTTADDLVADLTRCLEHTEAADTPVDLVLVDLPFGAATDDRARLSALSETALMHAVPVLLSLTPDFLAGGDGLPLARQDHPARRLEAPEYIKWHALREAPGCRWLAACYNDHLLRPAAAGAPALWGGAAWLVARRIIAAVQQGGWPVPITGPRAGRIEDLPLYEFPDGGQRPLREGLGNDACLDLATAGILALAGGGAADSAWIVTAPSLLAVPTLADAAETAARREDAGLVLQLLRARLLRLVRLALARAEQTGAGAAPTLERLLTDWLVDTGSGAAARLRRGAESRQATLTVEFGDQVGPGLRVDLELALD